MNTYIIKKIEPNKGQPSEIWPEIPFLTIGNFIWATNDYRPLTKAALFYTDTHLHIFFKSWEEKITVTHFNMDDNVYEDSCCEFFINPLPSVQDKYFNFEINAAGTLLLGLGTDRHDRERFVFDNFKELFQIKTSVTKENLDEYDRGYWTLEYAIPFAFFEEYFGKLPLEPGHGMTGNFYKCGDATEYPHFGCWNLISDPVPDFHRSSFFGKLYFE